MSSILDIDFTNYHKVQSTRLSLTSRDAMRGQIEQDLQVYLQAGGQVRTIEAGVSGKPEKITKAIKLARKMKP